MDVLGALRLFFFLLVVLQGIDGVVERDIRCRSSRQDASEP